MEVIDRRKFDAAGDLVANDEPETTVSTLDIAKALADVPRVYGPPHPILDRILVLRTKADTTFEGTHIIVPDIAKQDPNKGVVVAVSPVLKEHGVPLGGVWVPCQVKEGDVVTFTQFTDEQFKRDGDVYVLLRIHDIKFVEPVSYAVASH
ncbi:MAG: co-chaperone GroES [Acidobacteriota bacterium]